MDRTCDVQRSATSLDRGHATGLPDTTIFRQIFDDAEPSIKPDGGMVRFSRDCRQVLLIFNRNQYSGKARVRPYVRVFTSE
jgi:hypothetical protein